MVGSMTMNRTRTFLQKKIVSHIYIYMHINDCKIDSISYLYFKRKADETIWEAIFLKYPFNIFALFIIP